MRMRNNEPWDTAFDIYGTLATVTNLVLLVFASEEYATWTFTEKLMLFVLLIHMIFVAKIAIKVAFPEVPRSVILLHLKQVSMVHRCLENIKVEPQQDFTLFRQHGANSFEVMEQDVFDEDDIEPELNVGESVKKMKQGMGEAMDRGLICILCLTVGLTACIALALLVYKA